MTGILAVNCAISPALQQLTAIALHVHRKGSRFARYTFTACRTGISVAVAEVGKVACFTQSLASLRLLLEWAEKAFRLVLIIRVSRRC